MINEQRLRQAGEDVARGAGPIQGAQRASTNVDTVFRAFENMRVVDRRLNNLYVRIAEGENITEQKEQAIPIPPTPSLAKLLEMLPDELDGISIRMHEQIEAIERSLFG